MLDFLQETNPLLPLLTLALAYTFFYLLKKDIKQSALFAGIILLLLLIFSPGGQAIAQKTRYLSTPEARGECLVRSLAAGGLWKTEASDSSYCAE